MSNKQELINRVSELLRELGYDVPGIAYNPEKNEISFRSPIVREYSSMSKAIPQGEAECTMQFFTHDTEGNGSIEWVVEYADGEQDVEHIGIWVDENRVCTDYDGVFSLPAHALLLLAYNEIDAVEVYL